jgi:hypothetical protein
MESLVTQEVTNLFDYWMPFMVLVVSTIVVLLLKDAAMKIAKGISFVLKPGFQPGDICYLDGEKATIISIGIRETIFELKRDDLTTWRYVDNTKLESVKLEKIIK